MYQRGLLFCLEELQVFSAQIKNCQVSNTGDIDGQVCQAKPENDMDILSEQRIVSSFPFLNDHIVLHWQLNIHNLSIVLVLLCCIVIITFSCLMVIGIRSWKTETNGAMNIFRFYN